MKKILTGLLITVILLSALTVVTCANSGITIYVNENVLQCDTAPFIHNGRTMVPMRKIFEAYGASVLWDGDTRTVTANIEAAEIKLTIDDYTLYNNGTPETMDVATMIVNDTTFVPVRAISQSLGLDVKWLDTTKSVYISSPVAFAEAKKAAEHMLDDEVILTVDDISFSRADYNLVYKSIYQSMEMQYGAYFGAEWESLLVENGKTMLDIIKNDALQQLAQMGVFYKLAEENKIQLDGDIQTKVDEQMKQLEALGEAVAEALIEQMNTTKKAYRRFNEFLVVYESLFEKLTQPGQAAYVDVKAIEKEFEKNYWTVQHILVSNQERTDEEATAIVNEIYKKLKSGKKFAELIEEYNEDPGQTKDSFYTFTIGQMVPEFEEEAKSLATDKYSKEAVKTNFGYHIVKKYKTDLSSEEFKAFVASKQQALFSDLVQKKAESLTITVK